MTCVGIDLGTTNSLIAVYEENGPRLLPNALGEFLTPSVVGLADDGKSLLVGRAAKMRLVRHPKLTAARFKRLMGTDRRIRLGRQSYTAVELSAMVLRTLKADAEAALGAPVSEAVISVPAYFNGVQRQATKDAAEIAGLTVRRLINEPTAAALAAGVLDMGAESTFAVLDLGGGTFDVSILEMFEGVMEVRASSGDAQLGGEDFTNRIATDLARTAGEEWDRLEPGEREAFLSIAEELKRRVRPDVPARAQISIGQRPLTVELTTERQDEIVKDLVARLRRPIDVCLYDSSITVDDIDRVILVGGATRMPVVQSLAARVFRKLPERTVDPDHAIALGAAVQAGLVARHSALDDVVMTDVAPFSLGIASGTKINGKYFGDRFAPIIERNTILPASRSQVFATAGDNQVEIQVQVYQGESVVASENVLLGDFFVPVPRGPRGKEAIEVRFTYDVSGLLEVDVRVLSNGKRVVDVIDNLASAMTEKEKMRRLKELEGLKISPFEAAENVALIETLKHLHEMLLADDRRSLQDLLNQFEAVLAEQDPKAIAAERARLLEIVKRIEENYVR
ncbi:Hsp70 family protein [Pseudodonghicola xiamenensis]|nr:Hsp70 family protein [Pseudodonghicola xiamenensis]